MKLAEGSLIYTSIVYDSDDNLYGYFYLYQMDAEKNRKKLEYVLLDKNLNKVNNGEFSTGSGGKAKYKFDNCTLIDNKIILTKDYYYTPTFSIDGIPVYLATTFQIITLQDRSVSPEYLYKDGNFVEAPTDLSVLKDEAKKEETKNVISAFSNEKNAGFYITQYNQKQKNYLEKEMKFFDKDLKFKWKYIYNPNTDPENYTTFKFLHLKGDNIYITETNWVKHNVNSFNIVALNIRTGEKKYEYKMEFPGCGKIHNLNAREVEGKLVIAGTYVKEEKDMNADFNKRLGFYRIVLNENGSETDKKYLPWPSLAPRANINEKGYDKEGYTLHPRRYFLFANGKISIVSERYNPGKSAVQVPIPFVNLIVAAATYKPQCTGDIVVMNFNKDFALESADTIRKEVSKENYSDYLFSQYIRNDTAAVFFYSNIVQNKKEKKEDMILGIDLIADGKVSEEKIPVYSKKKYYIEVMPAKEGYIMLREYNEKEKYNQLRLEKLNYE
ncbi:MAG: hypothetical protein BGN96_12830 [Bacteroidales bacterium 45-6]|nr:MAG: hypothetical protein BGN96_12830 [Bacteroidales bacterium 45-6]